MKTKTLKTIIRQHYIIKLIIPILLVAVGCILLFNNPYSKRMTPTPLAEPSYVKEAFDNGTRYVHITVDKLYYTGADLTLRGRTKGRVFYATDNDYIYYFVIANSLLPENYSELTNFDIKCSLTDEIRNYDSLIKTMSEKLDFSPEIIQALSCNIIFDQYFYGHSFALFFARVVLVLTLLIAMHIILMIIAIIDPVMSYALIPLRSYGNVRRLMKTVEAEWADSAEEITPSLYFTGSFVIIVKRLNVDIIPMDNVVWIYRYNELHHRKGRHPHVSHPLCIVSDSKKVYKTLHIDENAATSLIEHAQNYNPNIMIQ